MNGEELDPVASGLEDRLLEAAARLDNATDCLACAQAAVALNSSRSATVVVERIGGIARQDFRFRGLEYLVIRDLAMALATVREGFVEASAD
jgi:hypothetical protein